MKNTMNRKLIVPLVTTMAVIAASCTKEFNEDQIISSVENNTLTGKLIGGSEGEIASGNLLLKLDEATVKMLENGEFETIADELLKGVPATSFKPALPISPKNADVARKYGLHQWYQVNFNEEIRPETAAVKLAESPRIRAIQYNRAIKPIVSDRTFDISEIPMTRNSGTETVFNDKYAGAQWNLHNDGTLNENAVAGADIGVKDAWRLTGGDPSVIVAIIDDAVFARHEDLKDAMWQNAYEVNGSAGVDDDGNGYIDDKNGFNFVNCFAINNDFINDRLDGNTSVVVKGNALNEKEGTGHGTHVAGIVGAVNNNGKGVSSVAGGTGNGDGVRLMSCQIVQGAVAASDAQIAAAYIYAADMGACVAQCSYGEPFIITDDDTYTNGGAVDYNGTPIEHDGAPLELAAMNYFLDPANSNHESLEGNMIIFAAGNQSYPYSLYPGAYSNVICVTAFAWDFLPGGYTNYGPGCNIAAPGGEFGGVEKEYSGLILSTGATTSASTDPGVQTDKGESRNYVYKYGTSMACPHVSGVVALGISYAKKLGRKFTREQMHSMLLTSVNDLDNNLHGTKKYFDIPNSTFIDLPLDRYYGKMGTGALDAWKFLMAIEGTPSAMVKAGEKTRIDLSRYCNPYDSYEISLDEASRTSLGISSDPVQKDGFLEIECANIGAGKIILSASVGKDPEKEDGIGGMSYTREISIVSRPFATNNGGWL